MQLAVTPGLERRQPRSAARSARRAALFALAASLVWAAAPAATSAQAAPRFEIVSVSHQPSGRLTAAVQASDATLLSQANVTVMIDGAQRPARVLTPQERPAVPVVLAVDTSGSMAGAPLVAAKDALTQLTAGLAPRDPVAVMAFSDKAEVRAPFGVDRARTTAAVQGITAAGGTALYQAVETASELAAGASTRGIVILISDGEDTSGKSLGRDTSLRAVTSRGIPVYVFGVGNAIDISYLQALAQASGGRYEAVANAEALRRVLADLGQTLGASTSIEVAVPPLARGSHSAQFRVGAKTPLERTVPFEVANVGLLTAAATAPSDPAAPIALKVTAPVPLASLPLKLRVGGRDWPLPSSGEVMLDPWAIMPGVTPVEVTAANDAGVIAQAQLTVTIPELQPVLTVKRDSTASGERLLINGRVQTTGTPSIVVRAGDRELLRSQQPLAQVTVPGNADVTVELLAGEYVVRTEAFEVGGLLGSISLPVAAAMAALLAIGAPLVLRRKRSLDPSAAVQRALQPATVRPARNVVPVAAASQAAEQMTNIIVRTPEGQTRRILVRRGASLTIGSDALCDIRLADDTVRARHGLLSRMEDGHFELHPITGQPGEPVAPTTSGRVLLRPGDPVRIGQHVLVIE